MRYRLNRLMTAIAITAATSGGALAADNTSQAQKGALPGVNGDYRIAKPAPQPEPDVRISGTITVDMATGGFKPPR
jgi:hypothetical protein